MYIHIYLLCKFFFTLTQGKCTKFTFTKPSISIFGGVSANGLGFKLETPTLVLCVFLSSLINRCVH
jgi:hypothetical protein